MAAGKTILPGAVLGVLGGGQLGRMFVQAAHRLGYRVHVLATEPDSPCAQVADHTVVAPYTDLDAVAALARSVEVVTFEFENIPAEAAEAAARHAPVRPAGSVLHTSQHRLREKTALRRECRRRREQPAQFPLATKRTRICARLPIICGAPSRTVRSPISSTAQSDGAGFPFKICCVTC